MILPIRIIPESESEQILYNEDDSEDWSSFFSGWIMELLSDKNSAEQMLMNKAAGTRTPVNGSIELLPLCNMNCDFCYVRLARDEMERVGRMHTADEWLSIGQQMKDAGTLFLLLTGGEPLLYPDFKKLYLGLRQMGMIITLNTNGTLMDEAWVSFFSEYKPRRINITLYGSDDGAYENLCHYRGGFDKVIRGIRLLRQADVDVRIGASVGRKNVKDVRKIIGIAKELDCAYNVDTYMMPASRERCKAFDENSRLDPEDAARVGFEIIQSQNNPAVFQSYARSIVHAIDSFDAAKPYSRHMSCLAGSCSFALNWLGYMRPCVVLNQPQYNVFEEGFLNSWQKMSQETGKLLVSKKCSLCPRRILCKTCVAAGLYEEGAFDKAPSYLCRYSEEMERLYRKEADQ